MGVLDRIMGFFGYMRAADSPLLQAAPMTRESVYAINERMYANTIYDPAAYGGALEAVLWYYFGIRHHNARIVGHFNPAAEIVDCYQAVLPGTWGRDMKPAEQFKGRPIDPALPDALGDVWEASNLDTTKEQVQRYAANFGTVGLRVAAFPRSPVIQVDHPARLFNVEVDKLGNCTSVVLKYRVPKNRGTALEPAFEMAQVIEQINRDEFSQQIDGEEQIPDDQRTNRFGFCPYVLLRHKDNGTLFGDWAYKGSERAIHAINYRIARQDLSIDRHQFPRWFATAGGVQPKTIELQETKITYVQTTPGTPPPSLEALVPKLDQKAAQEFWVACREEMRGRQPELILNDVKAISSISGETLAQLLKPVEGKILAVRPAYDHALIRALQMAVSMGVDMGLWDLGSGMGDGRGDATFQSGKLAFQFADRPALPLTMTQKIQQLQLEQAPVQTKLATARQAGGIVSNAEQLRMMGHDEEKVKQIQNEKATQDAATPQPL